MRGPTGPTQPGWRFRLIALVVGVILAFAVAEVTLRAVIHLGGNAYRANVLPLYEATRDHRPFALRKSFEYELRTPDFDMRIRTNDFGLRENQSIGRLLDHDFRILAMGDSHTFGYGVNFGERYSDRLNTVLGGRAVAFSSGYANGFSPVDYAVYLESCFSYLRPDIVVVGFFPENDVVNDVRTRRIERDGRGNIVATALNGFTVVDGFITANTGSQPQSVVRVKNWLWNTFAVYRLAEETRTRVRYWLHADLQNTQLPLFFFGHPSNQAEIDVTLGAIAQMDRFLRARGKTLLVFIIPSNFQVAERYESSVTRRPGYRASPQEIAIARRVHQPQSAFGKWLQAHGIRYIDPTQEFIQAEQQGIHAYFDFDGHLNQQGHALAARLIEDYLLRNRLVPCGFLTPKAAATAGCGA